MASTPTTRNRLLKQGAGDNVNTWGDQQSSGDFDMIDVALDGVLQLAISGDVTLSTANYMDDQARRRGLKFTSGSSASATVTLPALEKWYLIWNASTFDQIIASSGGGSTATVKAGEVAVVICDATNVARANLLTSTGAATFSAGATFAGRLSGVTDPASAQDAATKNYVDTAITAAVWSVGSFGVPITAGNAGQLLTNNGSTPSWSSTLATQLLISTAAGGTTRGLGLQTSGLNRFYLGIDQTAEGGSNAGSNFFLGRYNDAGVWIDNPLTINRATGAVVANGLDLSKRRIRRLFANRDLI